MTNPIRLELSPPQLRRLAESWHEQAHELLSAAALLGQGESGLPPSTVDGVHQFFAAWAAEIHDRGVESREIASALESVATTSQRVDEEWGDADRWPWAG